MEEKKAAVLLGLLGVKPSVQYAILDSLGSLSACFSASGELAETLARPLERYRHQQLALDDQVASYLDQLQQQHIQLLTVAEPEYPALLREIHRPPLVLYCKGDTTALHLPQLAIVGGRNCSRGGRDLAESFAASLTASGFVVTSGMALGVDGAAHRGAMRNGVTVAVLGSGVDIVYPRRHSGLYQDIIDSGGAVVSEFAPGAQPLPSHFPRRNRIISGLSLGVLVIEAALKSGSLITARQAMEQGREVFAIPGSIHNPMVKGCHQLIRDGAVLTESLADIVSQLGGLLAREAEQASGDKTPQLNAEEKRIMDAIGFDPVNFDELVEACGLSTASLLSTLTNLEIRGFVEQVAGYVQRLR